MDPIIIITYLYNSGFTIDCNDTFVVIDYVQGDLVLPKDKKIYFIVTHSHQDHYNPAIFSMEGAEHATYFLSNDVEAIHASARSNILPMSDSLQRTALLKHAYDPKHTRRLKPNENFDDEGLSVHTFGSTDQGISILFRLHNINFFHAGDLNAWCWPSDPEQTREKERRDYLEILHQVSAYPIDIGFGVVDPRLGEYAFIGGEDYLDILKPQIFIPMHFREDGEAAKTFQKEYTTKTKSMIRAVTEPGRRIIIKG